MNRDYKRTLIACYFGFVTQAIVANFAPLLFLRFHTDFGLSMGRVALISTVFFMTQLIVDLLCAKFVDKIGYRRSVVASESLAAIGLVSLGILPNIMPNPYIGIMISLVLYACGSGLIEVLVSPIVEACPFENKDSVMSLLHSFYCWGSVGVILLSTVFFTIFGIEKWPLLACLWAIIPFVNIFNFLTCPIDHLTEEGQGLGIRKLFQLPMFWVAIVLMICAGASELAMAQWASAYVESALGLSKTVGDVAGPCLFAVTMGLSRLCYGRYGHRMDLRKFMIGSGALCLICYLVAAFSCQPFMGLLGCIFCGFSVGIMWPGTISLSSARIPLGGTAMFAFLAMAGDMGGSIGPAIVGFVSQSAGDNLQRGLLAASIFPIILVVATAAFGRDNKVK